MTVGPKYPDPNNRVGDQAPAFGAISARSGFLQAMKELGYNQSNIGIGGTPPYTYALVPGGGSLPDGTTLNSSTGIVMGTATRPGPFHYSVQITDSSTPPNTTTLAVSGTLAPVVPGTTTISTPGKVGSYVLPPYNTLKVEITGTPGSATTVAQNGQTPSDIALSAGGGGPLTATAVFNNNVIGAPLNYSIGSSGGSVKITWS